MTNLAVLAMIWEIRVIELSLQANARLKERKERGLCLIKVWSLDLASWEKAAYVDMIHCPS